MKELFEDLQSSPQTPHVITVAASYWDWGTRTRPTSLKGKSYSWKTNAISLSEVAGSIFLAFSLFTCTFATCDLTWDGCAPWKSESSSLAGVCSCYSSFSADCSESSSSLEPPEESSCSSLWATIWMTFEPIWCTLDIHSFFDISNCASFGLSCHISISFLNVSELVFCLSKFLAFSSTPTMICSSCTSEDHYSTPKPASVKIYGICTALRCGSDLTLSSSPQIYSSLACFTNRCFERPGLRFKTNSKGSLDQFGKALGSQSSSCITWTFSSDAIREQYSAMQTGWSSFVNMS